MRLIETLARWAWETSVAGLVLLALALTVQFALRRPGWAPVRFALGLLVVARLLLPQSVESPFSIFNAFRPKTPLPPSPAIDTPVNSQTAQPSTSIAPSQADKARFSKIEILSLLWAAGAATLFARVGFQHLRVRRWIRAGKKIIDGPIYDQFTAAREAIGLRREIPLRLVSEIATPALCGVFRPVILLPMVMENAEPAAARLIFLHELAHVRHWDALTNWAMICARTLHWFNPIAWLALRRLAADQELLCDAAVVRLLRADERHAYGETLLAFASKRFAAPSTILPISTGFKQMKERIAMIRQFKPANRFLIATLPPLAAAIAIVTFTTAATPEKSKDKTETKPKAAENFAIKSQQLQVAVLAEEVEKLTERIRNSEKELDQLRKMLGIVGPVTTEDSLPLSDSISEFRKERIRSEQEYRKADELYSSLKDKSVSDLREILPVVNPDEQLRSYLTDLAKAEQQMAVMQKDYGDDHTEVVRLKALLKTINSQIDRRVTAIVQGTKTLAEARRSTKDHFERLERDAILDDAETREKARPFFTAKRDLETMRRMRDTLYMRLLEEKVDANIKAAVAQ